MNHRILQEWGFPVAETFLAAGPCSAESEEQLLETARALSGCRLGFFRAGLWKPRTRPGGFEGMGEAAIPWMVRVREETGLKIATEVAEPAHVEKCLEAGFDLLWLGARTVTNPFSVQAIADALRGVDIPVLVKNPMSADPALWAGAIERLAAAGLRRLGAIHRGFTDPDEKRLRNAPDWRIPIAFRQRFPDLPLLCDPSHIAGRADLVPLIAQEAMDLLFDGLMVEVHPDPPHALSDAAQQLTPARFLEMAERLVFPREKTSAPDFRRRLEALRRQVDEIDDRLLDTLARRMEIVREMGRIKAERNISTFQPERWRVLLEDRLRRGREKGLSDPFVRAFMQLVHEEAIRRQEETRLEGVPEAGNP